jgi:hypothetical protein
MQGLRDQQGTLRPIGIGSALVRFAKRALLAVIADEMSQWLTDRNQLGVGIRGGMEIVQFMVPAALDASPVWADMQGVASNALNDFLRRPVFEELSSSPVPRPLLRVPTMLYGRPSTLYVYDSSNDYVPAMRIPIIHGVH